MDEEKKYADPLFKHVFKTKSFGGFLSIYPFDQGSKFNIQIGELDADNKLVQVTSTYVEYVLLGAYLKAVVLGREKEAFTPPKIEPGTLQVFGGGNVDGNDVARVLKVDPPSGEANSFNWKCGHFKGRKTSTGAYIPDMSSPIQTNYIKISRQTMHEISYIIDLYMMKKELGSK